MKFFFSPFLLLSTLSLWAAYKAEISLDKVDGFYKCGEKAICTVLVRRDGEPLAKEKLRLTVKKEGKIFLTQHFETDGSPVTISHTLDEPGWLYFGVEIIGNDDKPLKGKGIQIHSSKPTTVAEIGALFDAEKIKTTVTRPVDFEAFWQKKREDLDKVPLAPSLTPLPSGAHNVELYAVEIPCTGSRPATGYLAVPKNASPESCPAVVEFRGWVYGDAHQDLAVAKAKRGVLSFYATWHGFPVGKPAEFYTKNIPDAIKKGELDIHDRDTWVMGDIYLRVMRIMDFIKSRPEWDKKNLAAAGRSLGGAQAAVAAALDKDVTFAVVTVPCFSEFDTRESGRMPSIPHRTAALIRQGDTQAYQAGNYFDLVNLAPLITCEVFVCTGFADEVCPASNVFAFYNALTCKKSMTTNPRTGHNSATQNIKGNQRLEELINSALLTNGRNHGNN
ncbi:MAG: prolyl oligopeptidase family serine peptidase [Oligosphaeraceae bacterium]|nr:prolyl oligopeptidase family serine peptidase [Oligosphaeraceae bacterium]